MKVCAAGILLKDNKVLLGKRRADLKFYPNTWDIIGGHCKNDEPPEQTLSRELKEELGITLTRFANVTVFHEPNPDIYGDYEYNVYLVIGWSGTPENLAPNEHSKLAWFSIKEASELDLAHPEYPALFRNIENNLEKAEDGNP